MSYASHDMPEPNLYTADPDDVSVGKSSDLHDAEEGRADPKKDKKKNKKDKKKGKKGDRSDDDEPKPKKEKKPRKLQRLAQDLDYIDRDPMQINEFCSTKFEEVIGEPDGLHSDDRVWVAVYKAFLAGKICCGGCLQYICAVPCSFLWGCCFSMLAFLQVYNITPCIRAFNMIFSCFSRVYATVVMCMCVPVYESCALLFTKIYVTRIDSAVGYVRQNLDDMNLMKGNKGVEFEPGKMA